MNGSLSIFSPHFRSQPIALRFVHVAIRSIMFVLRSLIDSIRSTLSLSFSSSLERRLLTSWITTLSSLLTLGSIRSFIGLLTRWISALWFPIFWISISWLPAIQLLTSRIRIKRIPIWRIPIIGLSILRFPKHALIAIFTDVTISRFIGTWRVQIASEPVQFSPILR